MKKTLPAARAEAMTHMREIPFAIAVAMSTSAVAAASPAARAAHFRAMRAQHRMPPL